MLTLKTYGCSHNMHALHVSESNRSSLLYLGSMISDFNDIFTVYSRMNLSYNRIKIFELPLWVISKMKVKSRPHLGKMTWPVLLIRSSQKFEFMTMFMFSRARNPFLTLLLSFHFLVTSKIQVNFRSDTGGNRMFLVIVSYRFSKFLDYIRF